MSKLSRAKKQAAKNAWKSAKKKSVSSSNGPRKHDNGKPNKKLGKMTGRRNFNQEFGAPLRYTPVMFVKSTEVPDFQLQNQYNTEISSSSSEESDTLSELTHDDSSSDDEIQTDIIPMSEKEMRKFDIELNSWLDKELADSEDEEKPGVKQQKDTGLTTNYRVNASIIDGTVVESSSTLVESSSTGYQRGNDPAVHNSESNDDISAGDLSDAESEIPDFERDLDEKSPRFDDINLSNEANEEIEKPGSEHNSESDSDLFVASSGSETEAESETEDEIEYESDESIKITLDDLENSDFDSDSEIAQDYLDNMSDIDDDQIFALAANQTVHGNEDLDLFETQLDERDDYFDELLESGLHPSDASQKLKTKKKPTPEKELRRAAKSGCIQPLLIKYPDFITIKEVIEELTNYVKVAKSNPKPLVFPPLDSNANWYLKQFAEYFNLTSKVHGSGDSKSVVVTLTNRSFTRPISGKISSLLNRRQNFRRTDSGTMGPDLTAALQIVAIKMSSKGKLGAKKVNEKFYTLDRKAFAEKVIKRLVKGSVKGFDPSEAMSHKQLGNPHQKTKPQRRVYDGLVVGQHAEEIKHDNFGHRLMCQMGWTQGSGLGSARAGIVVPIAATVKLTRGGLGG